MAESGRTPPPAAHRFVPTLTEVVLPERSEPAVAPSADVPSPITVELLEQIVDAAIKRTEAALTQKLPEMLSVILHEHALAVSERLRREIKGSVRASVMASLADASQAGALSGGISGASPAIPPEETR